MEQRGKCRKGSWNGLPSIYGVESRYNRLYRDIGRVGARSGTPRHDAAGPRHGQPARATRPACAQGQAVVRAHGLDTRGVVIQNFASWRGATFCVATSPYDRA